MIEPNHQNLSITSQCQLLSISRSGLYYTPKGESPLNLQLMRFIDEQFLKTPFYGSRQMARHLAREGYTVGRHRVRRLMNLMGIAAIYQKPKTTQAHPDHVKYPYLLRNMIINKPDQVWCADITYIPIQRGFLYLVAIMDWYSRHVLSWRLSNTMDTNFCIEALDEAIQTFGTPSIFNTDQGSQFTSNSFTSVLQKNKIEISMDGKGRWMDNVFIERLWRSLKYECVSLNAYESGCQARESIGKWFTFYNDQRPHSTLNGLTPKEVYQSEKQQMNVA